LVEIAARGLAEALDASRIYVRMGAVEESDEESRDEG
jgi:hypothetical protein